jgi:glyoxylase-like metal-dependent hydrolase (beta-lactamase superfamily II)
MMSRIFKIAAIVLFIAAASGPGSAQTNTPPPMTVQKIQGGLHLVKAGAGANTAFFIYDKGVVALDAKMTAEAAQQMLAEIKKTTALPLTHLLISHSDGDHINGLAGFPPGLTIVASEATRKEMEEAFKDEKFAGHRANLPNMTYTGAMELRLGESTIRLRQHGPAHTFGDSVIVFPAEKAAFIGDLVFLGRDPLIHRAKGGTSTGYIASLKKLLDLPVDVYLAGHNEPLSKDDVRGLLTALEDKQAKVKALVAQGKTLDEVKAALGVPAAAGRWPSLAEIMYLELTEKK